ncbi:hypothetical protein AUJ68_00085 [Candidatus Woesearchaeota archaeon CG1_02_57_44]|nr:MAG: hypothetical protein AUJ68_00085 [Candidatus Woesearchaeota archaeon CG1_02_57_44]PIN68302.1 MAG: transcriptional regulator [Candidatus Woesearchaeota archaeon CG11_big_fil_rev_8_21_14_0_20_57_5]
MDLLLRHLLLGTRGGETRLRLLKEAVAEPKNAHQLAKALGVDYKTVRHHLDVLQKNGLMVMVGEGYGAGYVLSPGKAADFGAIWDEFGKR